MVIRLTIRSMSGILTVVQRHSLRMTSETKDTCYYPRISHFVTASPEGEAENNGSQSLSRYATATFTQGSRFLVDYSFHAGDPHALRAQDDEIKTKKRTREIAGTFFR